MAASSGVEIERRRSDRSPKLHNQEYDDSTGRSIRARAAEAQSRLSQGSTGTGPTDRVAEVGVLPFAAFERKLRAR